VETRITTGGGGQMGTCKDDIHPWAGYYNRAARAGRFGTSQLLTTGRRGRVVLVSESKGNWNRLGLPGSGYLNTKEAMSSRSTTELIRSLSGGGDQGDLIESSARLKLLRELRTSVSAWIGSSWGQRVWHWETNMLRGNQKGSVNQGPNQGMEGSAKHDEKQEWALDVY
jgi:hypothetical protein